MAQHKIVFVDVDGTLCDYKNNIPASATLAIQKARAKGHRIYLCTGRSKAEIQSEIASIGFDGMIGGNGCYIESAGQVVMHKLITSEQCKQIVDWLHARQLEFYLESNNGLFASEHFADVAPKVLCAYAYGKGASKEEAAASSHSFMEALTFGANLYRDDVNKVSFILSSYQDHLDSAREFPDLSANTWGGKGEKALFGDLGVASVDKAEAVQTLIDYLGDAMADTIAIGDAKIDIPMFEVCAQSVCMGSGGSLAKAAADWVTTDVDNDGLLNAFKHLQLL